MSISEDGKQLLPSLIGRHIGDSDDGSREDVTVAVTDAVAGALTGAGAVTVAVAGALTGAGAVTVAVAGSLAGTGCDNLFGQVGAAFWPNASNLPNSAILRSFMAATILVSVFCTKELKSKYSPMCTCIITCFYYI